MTTDDRGPATGERPAYSSVEVTRNSRGYGWSVKCYVPAGDEDGLVDQVIAMEALLRARFGGDDTAAQKDDGNE